ncbi:hypothetical protein BJV82DRAFT_339605 [Fennellomyces sp. T-0311]|nr:hypothetical protein BJV82DRAFT_339605 [Fennellomyces sp. T-0311]
MTKTNERKLIKVQISTLSYCIHRNCEKSVQLYFKRAAEIEKHDVIGTAFMIGGITFERRVVQLLGNVVIDYDGVPAEESIEILRHAKVGTILYQLSFRMPESFYTQDVYRFSMFIPDFLMIKQHPTSGKRILYVIDTKFSSKLKLPHRIQVATYAYLLQYLVKDIDDLEVDLEGAIWLPSNRTKPLSAEQTEPISFRIDLMLPKIKLFYEYELPAILERKDPLWIFNETCKSCNFRNTCRNESLGTHSAVAHMTKSDLKYLKKQLHQENDIEDLITGLEDLAIEEEKPLIPEWMTLPRFKPYIEAYKTQKPQFCGIPTTYIGEESDHDIFLSLVYDPQFRMICTYAIRVFKSDGSVVEDLDCTVVVGVERQGTPDYVELAISLVKDLVRILDVMEEQKSRCAIFVADSSLKKYLHKCLIQVASLADSDAPEGKKIQALKAMRLLFALFPDGKILGIEKVPWYPILLEMSYVQRVISLEDLVAENIALGVPGFYDFGDMLHWLCNIDDDSTFNLQDLYTCWKDDKPTANRLFDHCEKMLQVLERYRKLANEFVQLTGKKVYCFNTAPFAWPLHYGFESPTMGRLAYFSKINCLEECKGMRGERMSDRAHEEKKGLGLRLTSYQDFMRPRGRVCKLLSFDIIRGETDTEALLQVKVDNLDAESTDFEYLLVPDTHEGAISAIQFPDLEQSSRWSSFSHALTNITSISEDRMKIVLDCNELNGLPLELGEDYRLYVRFRNFTTQRLLDGLLEIDRDSEEHPFKQIIRNPNAWSVHPYDYPPDKLARALEHRKDFGMSQSQSDISASIIQKRLQIIWGPPGSGKTTFLGLFINWYLTHMHPQGKPCIIGVTAFTRRAIMNLLKTIQKVQFRYQTNSFDVLYMKASSGKDEAKTELPEVDHCLSSTMDRKLPRITRPTVIGGTVWDFSKIKRKMGDAFECDMVIIDEGSQLPVPEAGLVIDCLDAQKGRLIIVGDHMQLGPILKLEFPRTEPPLYGSIQSCLMRTDDNVSVNPEAFLLNNSEAFAFGPNTIQLKDNWRMNDEMNVFYHAVYGDDIIAHFPNQRLSHDWTGAPYANIIREVLDPNRPITVVKIPFAPDEYDRQIEIEAQIVGELLEAHLDTIQGYDDKVMVVTPHHKQRVAVENQIQVRSLNRGKTRVDTVDKMQGQECPLVLACFTFNEITGGNVRFLLDFKRWNVTVSRAKCKVVVLTTDIVLSLGAQPGMSFDLFDNANTIEGWGFICMLKEWVDKKRALIEWER